MKDQRLIREDETSGLIDETDGQTSNKEGLQSSSRKPDNTGPTPHEEHKAPVSGAFGNEERAQLPVDKVGKKH